MLACPDDRRGRDIVTLSELNARAASEQRFVSGVPSDGITMDREKPAVPIPGPTFGPWVPDT